MANNIKQLRIGFLFTPREFSRLIGIYPEYLARLESGERALTDGWIDAISGALGIEPEAILDPDADIREIVTSTLRPTVTSAAICPIAARYAILALTAKTGGLIVAERIGEDDLADAVCNLISFVADGERRATTGKLDKAALSRLSKGLQITVLAILQSCCDDPPPDIQERLTASLPGAAALIEAFSRLDETARQLEME